MLIRRHICVRWSGLNAAVDACSLRKVHGDETVSQKHFGSLSINNKPAARNLGVISDSDLSLKKQITNVVQSARSIAKINSSLSLLAWSRRSRFQLGQNAAAQLVTNTRRQGDISPVRPLFAGHQSVLELIVGLCWLPSEHFTASLPCEPGWPQILGQDSAGCSWAPARDQRWPGCRSDAPQPARGSEVCRITDIFYFSQSMCQHVLSVLVLVFFCFVICLGPDLFLFCSALCNSEH